MPKTRATHRTEFFEFIADNVAWQRGEGEKWICDCIISSELLADLVRVALKEKTITELKEEYSK